MNFAIYHILVEERYNIFKNYYYRSCNFLKKQGNIYNCKVIYKINFSRKVIV